MYGEIARIISFVLTVMVGAFFLLIIVVRLISGSNVMALVIISVIIVAIIWVIMSVISRVIASKTSKIVISKISNSAKKIKEEHEKKQLKKP